MQPAALREQLSPNLVHVAIDSKQVMTGMAVVINYLNDIGWAESAKPMVRMEISTFRDMQASLTHFFIHRVPGEPAIVRRRVRKRIHPGRPSPIPRILFNNDRRDFQ